jgi:ankyrin repeat protein
MSNWPARPRWLDALIVALGAVLVTLTLRLLPGIWPRACVVIATVVFVGYLWFHPQFWYRRFASAVLYAWIALAAPPSLGFYLKWDAAKSLDVFIQGQSIAFHLAAAAVIVVCIWADLAVNYPSAAYGSAQRIHLSLLVGPGAAGLILGTVIGFSVANGMYQKAQLKWYEKLSTHDILDQTRFFEVLRNCREVDALKYFITNGANVNLTEPGAGSTPLHVAAKAGCVEHIKLLLAENASFDATDSESKTALHLVASNGNAEIATLLLERKANKEAEDRDGNTPLAVAIQEKQYGVASLLLDNGASVDGGVDPAAAPIFIAVKNGDLEAVNLLLKFKPDLKMHDSTTVWRTPLGCAVDDGRLEIAKRLLEAGSDPNLGQVPYTVPIWEAVESRDPSMLKLLLEYDAKLNIKNENDESLLDDLTMVLRGDGYEVIELLINAGADVNEPDVFGSHVRSDHVRIAELYLSKQPQLVHAKNEGTPVLFYVRSKEMFEVFMKHGADVEVRAENHGTTLLMYASRNSNRDIVDCLLDRTPPVDVRAKDIRRRTALHYALETHRSPTNFVNANDVYAPETLAIARLLLERDKELIDAPDSKNQTPAHLVFKAFERTSIGADLVDAIEPIKMLVEAGAKLDIKDSTGKAPMDLADSDFISALKEHLTTFPEDAAAMPVLVEALENVSSK